MSDVQPEVVEVEQDWYFTFGSNHAHPNHYHVIHGTREFAREQMFQRFGNKWALQYPSAEKAGVKRWNLKELK